MALQLNYCVPQDCDCKSVSFSDTTGVFNPNTNPTGYGGINIPSENVISSTITFFSPNETQGIVFAFTILNNIITGATRTDVYGNTINVFDYIPVDSLFFPFSDFTFDSPLLYGSAEQLLNNTFAQADLLDGSWKVTYTIQTANETFAYSGWVYLICQIKKCKEETMVGFTKGNVLRSSAIDVSLNFDSLINAVGLNNPTSVNNIVEILQSICTTCKTC
jgi:hypothetical protein